jgi:uncharacterized protein (TIGR02996 family)
MTEHHAFLAAMRADPHGDAPRLIYADWLEEQGDFDRAEFIRLQAELARSGAWSTREVEARFSQLRLDWLLHGLPSSYRWFCLSDGRLFVSGLESNGFAFEFSRGTVVGMALSAANWYKRGPLLVREHLLERVRLNDWYLSGQRSSYELQPPFRWRPVDCPVRELAQALFRSPTNLNKRFPSQQAAFVALSQACLDWAWTCEEE